MDNRSSKRPSTYHIGNASELLVASDGSRLNQKLVTAFGIKSWLLFHSLEQDYA